MQIASEKQLAAGCRSAEAADRQGVVLRPVVVGQCNRQWHQAQARSGGSPLAVAAPGHVALQREANCGHLGILNQLLDCVRQLWQGEREDKAAAG